MFSTILRLPKVMALTGLSRTTIYTKMNEGTFPNSVSLGARSVGWSSTDVDQWIEKTIKASRNNKGDS